MGKLLINSSLGLSIKKTDLLLLMVVSYFLERALWRWCLGSSPSLGSGPSLSPCEKTPHNREIIHSDIAVYPSL